MSHEYLLRIRGDVAEIIPLDSIALDEVGPDEGRIHGEDLSEVMDYALTLCHIVKTTPYLFIDQANEAMNHLQGSQYLQKN